jgi:hypothetical protein
MKKVLFLVMLTLTTAMASMAQISFVSSIDGTQTDTLVNAGTLSFTSPINALSKLGSSYTIQFKGANVSGTSTYKVVLRGTIDGTNYVPLHGVGVAGTNGIQCDTLQVTSGSPASFIFNAHQNESTNAGKVKRLQLFFIGTGTQVSPIGPVQAFVE